MATVIASLPKVIVFVALGTPSSEHSKGARAAKIVAIGVVVVITCAFSLHTTMVSECPCLFFTNFTTVFATRWIRRKMAVITKEIEAERAAGSSGTLQGGGDVEMGNRTDQDLK